MLMHTRNIVIVAVFVIFLAAIFYVYLYNTGSGLKPGAITAPTTPTTVGNGTSTLRQTTTIAANTTTIQSLSNATNGSLSPNPVTADWHGNVTTYVQGNYLVVKTNDVPPIAGSFPDKYDPNKIEAQNFTFLIPLNPQIASHSAPTPAGGQIGIALDGVVFFGPLDANGNDAVKVEGISFDQCNGHPQQYGVYHYHEFSPCIENSTPAAHSPLIGFAFDGFPIYGPNGANGVPVPQNALDACHGHYDPEVGSYVYVATTSNFPYTLGCYKGTPVKSDLVSGSP